MANKVYSFDLSSFGVTTGKPTEETTVNSETYSDISIVGMKLPPNDKFPDGKITVAKNIDIQAVKNSIANLFKFLPGERVLNPDYGNKLYEILYGPIDDHTKELVAAEIRNMISKYEPRAVLDAIIDKTDLDEAENNNIKFIVEWHVAGFENAKYVIPLP